MKPQKLEYVTPEVRAHGSIRALTKEIDTSPVIEMDAATLSCETKVECN